jgi:toxin HigB-1
MKTGEGHHYLSPYFTSPYFTRLLDAALRLEDLAVPPSNRLKALKGKRKGQMSLRINDQWRVCFDWKNGEAMDVEIVDYH